MAYTAFTDNAVFINPAINVVGNIFFDTAINAFAPKTISRIMAITGKTARVIQDTETGEVQNLAIITSDIEVFNHFSKNVKSIFSPEQVIKLKETIQFKKSAFNFEIHYDDLLRTINTVSGLYVQEPIEIPSYIL